MTRLNVLGVRGAGWRKLLTVAGLVAGLVLAVVGFAPRPVSQAAQGLEYPIDEPFTGVLWTSDKECSVTVVSEWLVLTAKHCGTSLPRLRINVASALDSSGNREVGQIVQHPSLDIEAIYLKQATGLVVTPLGTSITQDPFNAWGYGLDRSNRETQFLTRAEFYSPRPCPTDGPDPLLLASGGDLCWETTELNSVCTGDSGGPVTQNGKIIGVLTAGLRDDPSAAFDCADVVIAQAVSVAQMQPWLDKVIADAKPFP